MNIACIGNIVFDMSVWTEGFIKEDVRTNFKGKEITPGGPANNAAYVLAKFGSNVDLYGKIGQDLEGKYIYNQLLKEGINIDHISTVNNYTTPFSFIINNLLNSSRSICTIRDEKDFENPVIENINYEEKYDYILTDGKYPKETLELMKKNPNAITIIDAGRFNKYTKTLVKEIDIVICSKAFAKGITQTENCETDEEYIKLYKDTQRFVKNPKRLVITIGDKGYICEKDGEAVIVPAYNPTEPIIETTGAGDIFHGAFTHAISNNYDFHDALEFANITASLSTTKKGARYSCPNLQTVENIYHNMHINEDIYNKANYSETGKKLLLAPDLNDDVKSRML